MLMLSHSQFTQQWPNIERSFQIIFPSFVIGDMQSVWRVKIIAMQTFSCYEVISCFSELIKNWWSADVKTGRHRNGIFSLNTVSFTILRLMKPDESCRPLIMKRTKKNNNNIGTTASSCPSGDFLKLCAAVFIFIYQTSSHSDATSMHL